MKEEKREQNELITICCSNFVYGNQKKKKSNQLKQRHSFERAKNPKDEIQPIFGHANPMHTKEMETATVKFILFSNFSSSIENDSMNLWSVVGTCALPINNFHNIHNINTDFEHRSSRKHHQYMLCSAKIGLFFFS